LETPEWLVEDSAAGFASNARWTGFQIEFKFGCYSSL